MPKYLANDHIAPPRVGRNPSDRAIGLAALASILAPFALVAAGAVLASFIGG